MANNKVERPTTVIKAIIAPVPSNVKTQVVTAVQDVINKIKIKHLS